MKLPIFTARSDEVEHDICIYGYPTEIQALFFMAMRCALSWLDFGTINDIYGYKTEEYSQTALSKFNVIPESVSDCIFDFMPIHGGYLIGNVGPAMDFRWFCLGIFIATLSSLTTGEQGNAGYCGGVLATTHWGDATQDLLPCNGKQENHWMWPKEHQVELRQ